MTSWLLNFPNINLNIAEPIDEFVRYINRNKSSNIKMVKYHFGIWMML